MVTVENDDVEGGEGEATASSHTSVDGRETSEEEIVNEVGCSGNGIATSLWDVALTSFTLHGFDARCTHLAPSWSLRFSKVVDGMLGPERVRYLAARGRSGTEWVSYLALVGLSTLHSSRAGASGRFSTSLYYSLNIESSIENSKSSSHQKEKQSVESAALKTYTAYLLQDKCASFF
ncbi:hypothetical protein Bca52824_075335 [Brassica carinata]|uniref:Uncharacterized protein n=1 Tax=Brassica carinata TaxID=52824 RepID=A0A8X7TXV2_BRACI|nr:hypothetical protein Bca52824_075335 [Brassica carinata]